MQIMTDAAFRFQAPSSGGLTEAMKSAYREQGFVVLDGFASELYGDVRDAAKPVAALAITFYLSPADAMTPAVIWSREYRQRAPMADATPEALAQAWNAALSTILADLARDLAAAELSKP